MMCLCYVWPNHAGFHTFFRLRFQQGFWVTLKDYRYNKTMKYLVADETFFFQILFLWNIHDGDDSQDFVSRVYFSYIRLPQRCLELAGFHSSSIGVS